MHVNDKRGIISTKKYKVSEWRKQYFKEERSTVIEGTIEVIARVFEMTEQSTIKDEVG